VIGMVSPLSVALSLSRLHAGELRHRMAAVDLVAFVLLGFRLLLGEGEHVHDALARHEANAGVVGDDEIAGLHTNAADDDGAIDLHRFEPPLASDRRAFGGPDRIAELARLTDVAHAAVDDRAGFALALADHGADAAHVGHARRALDDEDVARLREVMALDLGHAIVLAAGSDHRIVLPRHVAQGQ